MIDSAGTLCGTGPFCSDGPCVVGVFQKARCQASSAVAPRSIPRDVVLSRDRNMRTLAVICT
jgi:hypothetical protein